MDFGKRLLKTSRGFSKTNIGSRSAKPDVRHAIAKSESANGYVTVLIDGSEDTEANYVEVVTEVPIAKNQRVSISFGDGTYKVVSVGQIVERVEVVEGTLPELVLSVTEQFATTASPDVQPSEEDWSTDSPAWNAGETIYVWRRIITTYVGKPTEVSEPTCTLYGTGADGKSAYELAVEAGFRGTEAEWLESLIGKDGDDGLPGDTTYLHIAYATSASGDNFSTTLFDGATYLGTCTSLSEDDPETASEYDWALIKGADGEDGKAVRINASTLLLRYQANGMPHEGQVAKLTMHGSNVDVSGTVWTAAGEQIASGPYVEITPANFTKEWAQKTSATTARSRSAAHGGDYVVIGGISGSIIYSKNCESWTKAAAFTSDAITGLCYGNGLFVAVDSGGGIWTTANPSASWTLAYSTGQILNGVATDGSGFVAVGEGSSGFVFRSADGASWEAVSGDFPNFYAVCFDGKSYYAIGAGGRAVASVDGVLWKETGQVPGGFDIRGIVFVNGLYLAGGQGGRIAYSYDGAEWYEGVVTRESSTAVSHIRALSAAYGTFYSVCYLSNGTGEIWKSNNGRDWTVCYSASVRLWATAFVGAGIIATGDNGSVYLLPLPRSIEVEAAVGNLTDKATIAILQDGDRGAAGSAGRDGDPGEPGRDGDDGQMLYATSDTDEGTQTKAATLTSGTLTLASGVTVSVKFAKANTHASPKLNVASTGAKPVVLNGSNSAFWKAGDTVAFVYDGSSWQVCSTPIYGATATIGNPAGGNVYVDGDSMDIRKGTSVLATFTAKLIELGIDAADAVIKMCKGAGIIKAWDSSDTAKGVSVMGGSWNVPTVNLTDQGVSMSAVNIQDHPNDQRASLDIKTDGTIAMSGNPAGRPTWNGTNLATINDISSAGSASSAKKLVSPFTARQASPDLAVSGDDSVRKFVATSTMTTNKPPTGDGHIMHFEWDNTGGYSTQLALKNNTGELAVRGMSGGTWNAWRSVLDSVNFSSYALPLTGGTMTGELRVNGGDVAGGSKIVLETGKGQITNSGTQTLFGFSGTSLLVGHSSYALTLRGNATRPIYNSKALALQSDIPSLSGYMPTSGGTFTGQVKINGNAASKPLIVRGIVGSDGSGNVEALYLQYEANKPIHLGNSGGYTISADGSTYSGTASRATADGNGNNIANTYLPKSGGTLTGTVMQSVAGNPYYGLSDGTTNWYFQAVQSEGKVGLGPTWGVATKWDASGNMLLPGSLDFSNSSAWVTPYLLAFKNADTSQAPTYPYTGFYQWGSQWQVNARTSDNVFSHNLLTLDNGSGNMTIKGALKIADGAVGLEAYQNTDGTNNVLNLTGAANARPVYNGMSELAFLSDVSNIDLSGYATTAWVKSLKHMTEDEVRKMGFLTSLPARLANYQDHTVAVADPNSAVETGFYYINTATNRPPFSQSTNSDYRVLTTAYSDQWLQQIATDFRCPDVFIRRRENGTWTDWHKLAYASMANTYDGEQKYQNSSYCPTVTDTASGVGCALKASRGMVNELLADKLIMTASTGKIPFYAYGSASGGQMQSMAEVAYIDKDGYLYAAGSIGAEGTLLSGKGALIQGRPFGNGDDEGIVIQRAADNNYAGVCLGSPTGIRSVFYLKPDNSAVWRYNNGTTTSDITHPGKSGTIALLSDIENAGGNVDLSGYMPKSGGRFTGPISFQASSLGDTGKALEFVCGIDAFASGGQMGWQSKGDFLAGYATTSWVQGQGYLTSGSNANTATMPLGFSSRSTGATWGNTTGTSFTCWNDPTGGSVDWRQDNPSAGKVSMKVDGRVYVNEGNNPCASMEFANSYWGMCSPDGENNVWIRTTSKGIIPYAGANAGQGSCYLGTSTWYFGYAYIDNIYGSSFSGTAARATADANGQIFTSVYAKKSDLNSYLLKSGGTMTGTIMQYVTGNPYFGLNDGTTNWYLQALQSEGKVGLGPTWTSATKWDASGNMSVVGKFTQGTTSSDSSISSMNRFEADLYVKGNGSAPNTPTVAGFYLGKSSSDENRHMDIVSGGDYAYIDFNKAGLGNDYEVRLLVNVTNGYTDFCWSGGSTNRTLNVSGGLTVGGSNVVTAANVSSYLANSSAAVISPFNASGTNGNVTLTSSAANYSILEIFYTDGSRIMSQRVYSPNNRDTILQRSVYSSTSAFYDSSVIIEIRGTTITWKNQGRLVIGTGSNQTVEADASTLKIVCVLGWK